MSQRILGAVFHGGTGHTPLLPLAAGGLRPPDYGWSIEGCSGICENSMARSFLQKVGSCFYGILKTIPNHVFGNKN